MSRGVRLGLWLLLAAAAVIAWRTLQPDSFAHRPRNADPADRAPLVARATMDELPSPPATRPSDPARSAESRDAAALGKAVWFHVTSTDGAPIAGAIGQAIPGGGQSDPTDDDGNGYLESTVAIRSAWFSARGFESAKLNVVPGIDSLDVKLSRIGMVTIRVTTSAGPPRPDTVTVQIERELEHGALERFDLMVTRFASNPSTTGMSFPRRGRDGFRSMSSYRANLVCLYPVKPDSPIAIVVQHDLGGEPVRMDVQVGATEWRVVDVVLPGQFGRLAGRVVGPSGDPVAGVLVLASKGPIPHPEEIVENGSGWYSVRDSAGLGPRNLMQQKTGADGAFDFGAVPLGALALSASSQDHALWAEPAHLVGPSDPPVLVSLDEGVTMKLTILDADGRPLRGAGVAAADRSGTSDAEGHVVLKALPKGRVTFDTFFGGVKTAFDRDTSSGEATLQIEYVNR
jgi:hypothetical protein